MLGWEFPPKISGGLGTACKGITKHLSVYTDTQITFVTPNAINYRKHNFELIGANQEYYRSENELKNKFNSIEFIKLYSQITPYTSVKEFELAKSDNTKKKLIHTNSTGKFIFTGDYNKNLIEEVYQYATVLYPILNQRQFDIIHAHDWPTFPGALRIQKTTKCKFIAHIHSTEFDRNRNNINSTIYSIERLGMERADAVITVSNYAKKIINKYYDIPLSKIKVIYNGVDRIHINQVNPSYTNTNKKIISFVGRVTGQKGPMYFVEAARIILRHYKNYRFIIAGNGDQLNEIIKRTLDLNIYEHFQFLGFLDPNKVIELLKSSDVFVMPSVSEPFGISALEAIQCKTPVIISKNSGITEVVDHLIQIKYCESDTIADAILTLSKNNTLRKSLIRCATKDAQNLTWKNTAKAIRKLYLDKNY